MEWSHCGCAFGVSWAVERHVEQKSRNVLSTLASHLNLAGGTALSGRTNPCGRNAVLRRRMSTCSKDRAQACPNDMGAKCTPRATLPRLAIGVGRPSPAIATDILPCERLSQLHFPLHRRLDFLPGTLLVFHLSITCDKRPQSYLLLF